MNTQLTKKIHKIEKMASLVGLIGISIVLLGALYMQFIQGEDPCPLCLLQRAGLVGIGIAMLMNIIHGIRASHWALALINALAGIAVSIRQILLHINDPIGFASPVFGLHLYTWCFIIYTIVLIGCSITLLIHSEE